MKNDDIRNALRERRIYHWEVAEKLGISASHFSRILRYDLSEKRKDEIWDIIRNFRK